MIAFVNYLLNEFAICLAVVAVFVLIVSVLFCERNHVLSSRVCVCFVCNPTVSVGVPSI